jgi:hypothetical protein
MAENGGKINAATSSMVSDGATIAALDGADDGVADNADRIGAGDSVDFFTALFDAAG